MPSSSCLITIWQAMRVHLSLYLGNPYRISSSYSLGAFNLLYSFYISTLQVVHANCLSHNPYTFTFSFTVLLVRSIRLSSMVKLSVLGLHYMIYSVPLAVRMMIWIGFISLGFGVIIDASFFHIVYY